MHNGSHSRLRTSRRDIYLGGAAAYHLMLMVCDEPFQKCGSCGKTWAGWQEFVFDPSVLMLGFQAFVPVPDANLLVFEHRCGSSISILARRLRHLGAPEGCQADDPVLFGTETCNEYCRDIKDLRACDRPCANARDRRVVQLLFKMKQDEAEKRNRGPEAGNAETEARRQD
jgi:hypothetical protein